LTPVAARDPIVDGWSTSKLVTTARVPQPSLCRGPHGQVFVHGMVGEGWETTNPAAPFPVPVNHPEKQADVWFNSGPTNPLPVVP
jgi:hypothetical protein